jgi:hypothetical protein
VRIFCGSRRGWFGLPFADFRGPVGESRRAGVHEEGISVVGERRQAYRDTNPKCRPASAPLRLPPERPELIGWPFTRAKRFALAYMKGMPSARSSNGSLSGVAHASWVPPRAGALWRSRGFSICTDALLDHGWMFHVKHPAMERPEDLIRAGAILDHRLDVSRETQAGSRSALTRSSTPGPGKHRRKGWGPERVRAGRD